MLQQQRECAWYIFYKKYKDLIKHTSKCPNKNEQKEKKKLNVQSHKPSANITTESCKAEDKPTAYFHLCLSKITVRNHRRKLKNVSCVVCSLGNVRVRRTAEPCCIHTVTFSKYRLLPWHFPGVRSILIQPDVTFT